MPLAIVLRDTLTPILIDYSLCESSILGVSAVEATMFLYSSVLAKIFGSNSP